MNYIRISDEAENVEKVLTVVVKRRKKLPIKCMELCKQISTFELLRLVMFVKSFLYL